MVQGISNYPPGTWDGDPLAPWNKPDPWEGETCGTCADCHEVGDCDGMYVCVCICGGEVDFVGRVEEDREACEGWHGV